MTAIPCLIDTCPGNASSGPYCEMHRKRLAKGLPMHTRKQERLTPFASFVRCAVRLADADSEDDQEYREAVDAARKASARWYRSLASSKAAKARWSARSPAQRSAHGLKMALARWPQKQSSEGKMLARKHAGAELPETVQAAAENGDHGRRLKASSGHAGQGGQVHEGQQAHQSVPARRQSEPGRPAGVGEGDARPGRQPRAPRDRASLRDDGEVLRRADRGDGGRGAPRPSRPEAVHQRRIGWRDDQ